MNYIHRNLENIISKAAASQPAVLIYGQHLCGKTTLVRSLSAFSRYACLDLHTLSERAAASADPEGYTASLKKPVIIDNLQYVPQLLPYISKYVSEHRTPGSFVLISSLTPDYLVSACRRTAEAINNEPAVKYDNTGAEFFDGISCFRLTPLSQAEISGSRPAPFSIDIRALRQRMSQRKSFDARGMHKRILRGSMPSILSGDVSDIAGLYNDFLSLCTERELRLICESCTPLLFWRFIRAAASQCGKMLNISRIAVDAGINQKQAKELLAVLEYTGTAFMLYPYSDGSLNRLVKTPKLYFFDTGLACMLAGITDTTSPDVFDSIFENYAASEIAKSCYESGVSPQLWYYRNKDAREVNLLIEGKAALYPVSISSSQEPSGELTLNFPLLDRAKLPRGTGAVICMKQQLDELSDGTLTVPLWTV